MKSFAMLRTAPVQPSGRTDTPIEPDQGETRYFIDGKRVDPREYRKLTDNCARQDSFQTYQFAGRFHMRSVCHV